GQRSQTGDRARRPSDSRSPPLAFALLFRRRPQQSLFQPVDSPQHLTMNLNQAGATLAEAPVVLGQAAPAGPVLGAHRAEPGSAGVAPTQHQGRVGWPLGGGAVTGRLAATRLQLGDGAFQQLPQGQDLADEAAIVLQQTEKNPGLAAGLIEAGGQD